MCSSPRILQSNGLRRLLNNYGGGLTARCIGLMMAPTPTQNQLIHPRCLPEMKSTSSPASLTTKLLMRLVTKVATPMILLNSATGRQEPDQLARRVLIQPLTCLVGEREEFLEGNGSAFLVSISVGFHPAGETRNLPGRIGVVQLADHWVGRQSGSGYSGTRGCALRILPATHLETARVTSRPPPARWPAGYRPPQ